MGDLPHVGQLLSKGPDGVKVQPRFRQNIIAPDFLGLQLPVGGAPVGGVAVPALRQKADRRRSIQIQAQPMGPEDAENALSGLLFAGLVNIDVFQRSAHVKQYGIDHNITAFFKRCRFYGGGDASSSSGSTAAATALRPAE